MTGLNLNLHEAVSLDFRLKCIATLVCTLTKVTEFSSWTNPLIVRPKMAPIHCCSCDSGPILSFLKHFSDTYWSVIISVHPDHHDPVVPKMSFLPLAINYILSLVLRKLHGENSEGCHGFESVLAQTPVTSMKLPPSSFTFLFPGRNRNKKLLDCWPVCVVFGLGKSGTVPEKENCQYAGLQPPTQIWDWLVGTCGPCISPVWMKKHLSTL